VPIDAIAQATREPFESLTAAEGATLEAIVARLIPTDANGPGATEARAARYIDRALGGFLNSFLVAYRTGLAVEPVSEADAAANYAASRDQPELAQKVFRDFLLCHTMDVARERGLWIHIHAAVGDPDIVYQRANPALLYPLLHSERFRRNKVVLVHGGWPWVGEAASMVAIRNTRPAVRTSGP